MRPVPKKKLNEVYPVEVQSKFPWLLTRCTECGYTIAGPGEVYLKDAGDLPFCRPECAWKWAKENGVRARQIAKKSTTPRKRLKGPRPQEQTEAE